MKVLPMLAFGIIAMSPTTLLAQTPPTYKAEGVKASGAGSWNPPNSKDLCDGAKKDAMDKAASAGFKGKVVWDRLSTDNDCQLKTTKAGTIGWFYIMTAKGTVSQTGIQEPLNPQTEYKAKFKAGCLSTKQTWIENPDGSYQCTTSSGEINKCYKNSPSTPCTHTK